MPLPASIRRLVPSSIRRPLKQAVRQTGRWTGRLQHRLARPNPYDLGQPERLGVIYDTPSEMTTDERLLLYALVRGLRPQRILEVGSRAGGSAAILACALEDNGGPGRIIGVDPKPAIEVKPSVLHGRFELVGKPSPEGLAEARQRAGGPFDLALIDGLHTYDQVVKDIAGTLPLMVEGAYLLFHDALHVGVSEAIREAIEQDPRLHDCGYLCATPKTIDDEVAYHGIRVLRFADSSIVDPQPLIERGYRAAGKTPPRPDSELRNHDAWYCRHFSPCPKCRREAEQSAAGTVSSRP